MARINKNLSLCFRRVNVVLLFLYPLDPKKLCLSRIFKGKCKFVLHGNLLPAVLVGQNVIFIPCKRQRKRNLIFFTILSAESQKHARFGFGIKEAVSGKGISLVLAVPRCQNVKFLQKIGFHLCPFTKTEAQNAEILVGILHELRIDVERGKIGRAPDVWIADSRQRELFLLFLGIRAAEGNPFVKL